MAKTDIIQFTSVKSLGVCIKIRNLWLKYRCLLNGLILLEKVTCAHVLFFWLAYSGCKMFHDFFSFDRSWTKHDDYSMVRGSCSWRYGNSVFGIYFLCFALWTWILWVRHDPCVVHFTSLLGVLCVRHTPILYLWHGNSIFGMIRIFTFDLGIMISTCFIVNTFYLGNPMFGAFDKIFSLGNSCVRYVPCVVRFSNAMGLGLH